MAAAMKAAIAAKYPAKCDVVFLSFSLISDQSKIRLNAASQAAPNVLGGERRELRCLRFPSALLPGLGADYS
jgi:hypothetical protein